MSEENLDTEQSKLKDYSPKERIKRLTSKILSKLPFNK
tara:strand:- start:5 stop:118 length:114 start_codon:yes stop_codon:yes gene_type:complete